MDQPVAAPAEAVLFAFPARPEDRLRLALRRLEESLEEQRQAVAAWRESLAALKTATGDLGGSLESFQGELAGTAAAVRAVGDEARRLEVTADAMLEVAATAR